MTAAMAVLIAGPTASGKSLLALELARLTGGAVINADSLQVYRDLRVITARPSPADAPGHGARRALPGSRRALPGGRTSLGADGFRAATTLCRRADVAPRQRAGAAPCDLVAAAP